MNEESSFAGNRKWRRLPGGLLRGACLLLLLASVLFFGVRFFGGLQGSTVPALSVSDQRSNAIDARRIEDILVGQRVVADDPEVEISNETAVDPATWRHLALQAVTVWEDGTVDVINAETLQPPEWVAEHNAQVGHTVPLPLDLLEMGLDETLRAEVVANHPCPELEDGPGYVVLTTVNHLNRDVYEIEVADAQGRRKTFRPTGLHKFYSESRDEWIATRYLGEGEKLQALDKSLSIVSLSRVAGVHRVYNMTVEGEHVYHVSRLGTLSHNTNPCAQPLPNGPNTPVMPGNRGTYTGLKAKKRAFGQTEPVEIHEMPSYAAKKEAFFQKYGRYPSTPGEKQMIRDLGVSEAVTPAVHSQTRTWRGRNTRTQVQRDAANLSAAQALDEQSLRNAKR